jgi:nucleotide-binding universal stress UspA family protein
MTCSDLRARAARASGGAWRPVSRLWFRAGRLRTVAAAMDRLLVAVDGSPHSLKGVDHAVELARAMKLKVELANVLPPILLAPSVYADTIAKLERGNQEAAQALLEASRKTVVDAGVECDTTLLTGAPAEALADRARDTNAWAVVIGAKGHGPISRVLLGSVTDRLVHIASRPVLVIR